MKMILLVLLIAIGSECTAQSLRTTTLSPTFSNTGIPANKITKVGDSLTLSHFPNNQLIPSNGLIPYLVDATPPYDSGYLFGSHAFNLVKEYAERYEINGADSSVKVIGVVTLFTGTYQPNTNKNIVLKVWSSKGGNTNTPNLAFNSSPFQVLTSQDVSIKSLGIRSNPSITSDTFKTHYFSTPTAYLSDTFYVGYEYNYDWNALNGDIIGLYSTVWGTRNGPLSTTSGSTTIINNQNMYRGFDNFWYDIGTDYVPGPTDWPVHLAIWPVVMVGHPNKVASVHQGNLSLHGAYPNPAINDVNIRFSLKNDDDITVRIINVAGSIVSVTQHTGMKKGEQTIRLNTEALPGGAYTYLLQTSNGTIASQFNISR